MSEQPERYKVDLEAFSGPLDLLLYLIRQSEVEIYDIPIAEITDQYLAYIDLLKEINVSVAGEFVWMAATLMEIKSRMLLPREELPEGDDLDDPRMELVQQLLEYQRYKDAALSLEDRASKQSQKFTRPPMERAALGDVSRRDMRQALSAASLWDLLTAFSRVLKETAAAGPKTIIYDGKPQEQYLRELLERLQAEQSVGFFELFAGVDDRAAVIGVFLAILELVRLEFLRVEQAGDFGNIRAFLTPQGMAADPQQVYDSSRDVASADSSSE